MGAILSLVINIYFPGAGMIVAGMIGGATGAAVAAFMYVVSIGVNRISGGGQVAEEVKTAAKVAHCAYQDKVCSLEGVKFNPVNKDGFKYAEYTAADGTLYIGFAGTDTGSMKEFFLDMKANLMQGMGPHTAQYDSAVAVALAEALGGGVASAAAAVNKSQSIAFNSSGIRSTYGGSSNTNNTRAFYDATDGLSALQDLSIGLLVPGAIGQRSMLPAKGFHGLGAVCQGMGLGGSCGN